MQVRIECVAWTFVLVSGALMTRVVCADIPRGRFVNPRPVPGIDLEDPTMDCCLALSPNGLSMIFTSTRGGGHGGFDMWEATRTATSNPFDDINNLGPELNGLRSDGLVFTSNDNESLYFSSNSLPGEGGVDIFRATRSRPNEPFGNPSNLGTEINSPEREAAPSISADGRYLFFEKGPTGNTRLWMATWDSTTDEFVNAKIIDELDSGVADASPSVSSDALFLFFDSDRDRGDVGIGIWVSTRESLTEPFGPPTRIDGFSHGSEIDDPDAFEITPHISSDWPNPGSRLYYSRIENPLFLDIFEIPEWTLYEATWILAGDFNENTMFDAADIDMLSAQVRGGGNPSFDLTDDGVVDQEDRCAWVEDIVGTYFGDANLDGEFNSQDLVIVFQAGEYEDALLENSTWTTGDWNGDAEFNSNDFVLAFQSGGYEQGPRSAIESVPEPSTSLPVVAGALLFHYRRRKPVCGAT